MNIGFIGIGKISSAVIESICTSGLEDYHIYLSPRNKETSLDLAEKFDKVTRTNHNQDVLDNSDIIFLALRPTVYKDVLTDLHFSPNHTVVSFIPFSFYDDLAELTSPAAAHCRATPLPTVTTHICPIPVFRPNAATMKILGHIGQPFEVSSEEELHTIWTLTSLISPYYDMLNALSKWASENSVDREAASKYVADMFNTLSYAAHLKDYPDFNLLSHHAATPGGLNQKTALEIESAGAHMAYTMSAEGILEMFRKK